MGNNDEGEDHHQDGETDKPVSAAPTYDPDAKGGDNIPDAKTNKRHDVFGGPTFWTLSEIFTIVVACGSIASAIVGYRTVRLAQTSVSEIVANWKTPPITNVKVVDFSTSGCPSGYSQAPFMTWPGVSTACGCPTDASYAGKSYSSNRVTECSKNQTSAGCVTVWKNVFLEGLKGNSKYCL